MSKKFMDPLAGLSDDDSDADASGSGSDAEEGAGGGKAAAPPAKRQKAGGIDLETLKAHGYKEGPSVLFVPDKADGEQNWGWADGKAHKQDEVEEEDFGAREANRRAVNEAAEESALLARKAVQQAEALRRQKAEEQRQLKESKRFSWNEKEKRKRAEGKASRGGSYVEEEKRKLREHGVMSGFD